jgi:hypothetical protein
LFTNITDEDIAEAELEPAPLPDAVPADPNADPEQVREPLQLPPGQTGDSKPRRWWWFGRG